MPVNQSTPNRPNHSAHLQPAAFMAGALPPMMPGTVFLIPSPTAHAQPHQYSPVSALPSVTVGAVKSQLRAPLTAQPPQACFIAAAAAPPPFSCSEASDIIPLIDPTGFGGLVHVPIGKTLDTKGRAEYLKGALKKEVSLCCLYQKGRCHAQEKCHQIHVDLAFMRQIRSQNAGVVSCCRAHADTASSTPTAQAFFSAHVPSATVSLVGGSNAVSRVISAADLAFTVGLQTHVSEGGNACALPIRSLCRLHLRSACKYGKDCKRIHVCSKLGEGLLDDSAPVQKEHAGSQRASSSRQSPAPAPVHVRVGSTEYTDAGLELPRSRLTPPPSARSNSSTPGTECVFNPVFLRSPATRRNSLSSDAGGSVGPATPPPLESIAKGADVPPLAAGSDECPALTLDAVNGMEASSFLEHSYKVPGLCFDPLLLCQRDTDLWGPVNHPSCRTNVSEVLDHSIECGASSTTSFASPSRLASVWL